VTIGPAAARLVRLDIPVVVSDVSFGALYAEAKVAHARGAEGAGTAICSGEGGMLPEEQAECTRYLYELASGRFGSSALMFAPQAPLSAACSLRKLRSGVLDQGRAGVEQVEAPALRVLL
jgi:glutamate synthase domain-containing protein 2